MRRFRSIAVLGICLLGAVLLFATGPVEAGKVKKVKTTVTITSGAGSEFKGKIASAQKRCRVHRLVKLVKDPYTSAETTAVVGTARTNGSGEWSIKGSFMAGLYHAQAPAWTFHEDGDTIQCKVDVSVSSRF